MSLCQLAVDKASTDCQDERMATTTFALYRVETFDYFGRRAALHRFATKAEATATAQAWLDESKHHTVKVTCGNDGAPISNW